MTQAGTVQLEWARRVLAHEGASGSSEACAAAASRVHDKLHAHLDRLLGFSGVQALLIRSARLALGNSTQLAEGMSEGSTEALEKSLRALEPAAATEGALALFGSFFTLLTTFIGERLTYQALRNAWPTLEAPTPEETDP